MQKDPAQCRRVGRYVDYFIGNDHSPRSYNVIKMVAQGFPGENDCNKTYVM